MGPCAAPHRLLRAGQGRASPSHELRVALPRTARTQRQQNGGFAGPPRRAVPARIGLGLGPPRGAGSAGTPLPFSPFSSPPRRVQAERGAAHGGAALSPAMEQHLRRLKQELVGGGGRGAKRGRAGPGERRGRPRPAGRAGSLKRKKEKEAAVSEDRESKKRLWERARRVSWQESK